MQVLKFVRPYVQNMMVDKMDIYRHVTSETEYGSTEVSFPNEPTYSDVPCRLSWSEVESPRNYDDDYTPIELPIKIICKYDQDILAGDYVIIRRYSGDKIIDTYKGICGDSATYESHKELYFRVQEPA